MLFVASCCFVLFRAVCCFVLFVRAFERDFVLLVANMQGITARDGQLLLLIVFS